MRILAIDFGLKKIGVATTDMNKTIAYPLKTILSKKDLVSTTDFILVELKEYLSETEEIVIGLPLHMDGKDSKMSEIVKKFSELLKQKTNKKIKLIDERLSSKQAEKELSLNFKLNAKKSAKIVDSMSAALILKSYLG